MYIPPTIHCDQALVKHLDTLPVELVHEIFDSLPLASIIPLIIGTSSPHLERCLLSHLTYGRTLTPENLAEIKGYALIHAEICPRNECPLYGISPTWTISWFQSENPRTYAEMRAHMAAPLMGTLERDFKPYVPVLRQYSPKEIPDDGNWKIISPDDIRQLWDILEPARAKLRAVREAQLTRMADMLERYPQMLRPTNLQSQEARTKSSVAHSIAKLRRMAKHSHQDEFDTVPWVPHDRYLRMFLKILRRFPHMAPPGSTALLVFHKVLNNDEKKHRRIIPRHNYPDNVLADIKTALAGLENQYRDPCSISVTHEYPPLAQQSMVQYTVGPPAPDPPFQRASDVRKPHGFHQPKFNLQSRNGAGAQLNVLPFDEREFEWLEAFCRTCRWMLDKMTGVTWVFKEEGKGVTKRISVSRYWSQKIEDCEYVAWGKLPTVWAEGHGPPAWKDGDARLAIVKGKAEKKEDKGKGLER